VTLFGSRAKGTASDRSDVDLAVRGDLTPLQAEAIAGELDELPLPYRFEVQPIARIRHSRCGITSTGSASASIGQRDPSSRRD
jgi:hypothetical protein